MPFGRKPQQNQAPQDVSPEGKKGKRSGKSPLKKGGKSRQFVMLIGDEGAILVFMEGSKVVRRLFSPSAQPSNTEAMVSLMQSNPKVPLSLLVDSMDQQYVRQSFPPVSSLSVNGLVKRRLDRDFQAEDLKGFLPLGRDKMGRKEWNFLLISLAKTTALTEWIDLVSDLPNEFKGVYLVPVEGVGYVQAVSRVLNVPTPKPWQLLVTHNKISGFRQIVVHQGKLVFTRVSQAIDDAIPAVIAGNIEQEIINTIEYLRRLDFQDTAGLDIFVIASLDVNEALDLRRFNLGYSRALSPLDVAEMLEFEQAALSADRFGDVVLASAFLRSKKQSLRLSTAYAEAIAKLYTLRKGLAAAAALLLLLLIWLNTANILNVIDNQSFAKEAEIKRQGLQAELTNLKKSISNLHEDVAFKAAVVTAYETHKKDGLSPVDFAQLLTNVVTQEQRILGYEWQTTASNATQNAPASGSAPNSEAAKGPLSITVNFEFTGSYSDVSTLSESVEKFIQKLSASMPDYTVTHDPFPWKKAAVENMEISFDTKQPSGIKEGDNRLKITFTGPHKKEGNTSNTPNGGTP